MQPKYSNETAAAQWRPPGVRTGTGTGAGPLGGSPGFFREGSVYRRVSGEGVLLAGGAAALLLQLAHPEVARGVAQHSDFTTHRLARLRGTLEFVYVVAFGTRAEAERVSAAVRLVTAGLLPRPIRDQYGLKWNARREWVMAAGTAVTRTFYPRMPGTVRHAPKAYYLRGLRARMPVSA